MNKSADAKSKAATKSAAKSKGKEKAAGKAAVAIDFGSDDEAEDDPSNKVAEAGTALHEVLLAYEKELGFTSPASDAVNSGGGGGGAAFGGQGEVFPILSSHERAMRHKYCKSVLEAMVHCKKCGQCGGHSPR